MISVCMQLARVAKRSVVAQLRSACNWEEARRIWMKRIKNSRCSQIPAANPFRDLFGRMCISIVGGTKTEIKNPRKRASERRISKATQASTMRNARSLFPANLLPRVVAILHFYPHVSLLRRVTHFGNHLRAIWVSSFFNFITKFCVLCIQGITATTNSIYSQQFLRRAATY